MTDPSRFQAHWKTPFLFSSHEKSSPNDMQQYLASSLMTDSSLSARSLPSSPHHHHLRQTNCCVSFQPFDPFDTDDSTATANKDAELDQLSTLLSRQFLEDVDAETIPSSSSPTITTTKTTSSTMSTPNTRMLGAFPHSISSPWSLDDGISFKQPWSPALSSSGLLASPNNTDTTQWNRFEPYGNDSEFDPTLPFYQAENDHFIPIITTPNNSSPFGTTTTNIEQQENLNVTTLALRKLSLLFPDLDEKELEQTLAALDYDVERTIEALSPKSLPTTQSTIPPVLAATSISKAPTTATAEKVHLIKSPSAIGSPTNSHTNNEQSNGTIRKRQVCRHYLAGECYRKDCWFAHDLEVKPCKFWLQGLCLKGDTCEFAHSLEELEQVAKNHHHPSSPSNNNKPTPLNSHHHQQQHHQELQQQQQQQQYTSPTVADFPILVARSKRKSKKKSHNKKIKS